MSAQKVKGLEIERAFHVLNDEWREQVTEEPTLMVAGYLCRRPESIVRVRIEGQSAKLCIKGKSVGPVRFEQEWPISISEAKAMFEYPGMLEGSLISKMRHLVKVGDHVWEVDEFISPRQGYVRAEIELCAADEHFEMPSWAGEEITTRFEHSNAAIASEPPSRWVLSRHLD